MILGPEDGRLLWEMPFTTPYDQNIVDPVVLPGGEVVIFAGLGNPTFAVRFRGAPDGGLAGETVWEADESPFYMSNPVLAGDRLIGFSERNSGQWVALDPATGADIWRSPPRSGENAALLVAGRTVLALTDSADLLVLDAFAPALRTPTPLRGRSQPDLGASGPGRGRPADQGRDPPDALGFSSGVTHSAYEIARYSAAVAV